GGRRKMTGAPAALLHDYCYTSHKVELGVPGYRRGVRISPTGRAYVLRGACDERLHESSQQRGAQVVTQGHEYTLASNGGGRAPMSDRGRGPTIFSEVPRPQTDNASRPPPPIVRRRPPNPLTNPQGCPNHQKSRCYRCS